MSCWLLLLLLFQEQRKKEQEEEEAAAAALCARSNRRANSCSGCFFGCGISAVAAIVTLSSVSVASFDATTAL